MNERPLEEAIDRTVREMMQVDADGAFRARVTARLPSRQRESSWPHLTAAAFAGAAMAVAIMTVRTPAPEPRATALESARAHRPERPPASASPAASDAPPAATVATVLSKPVAPSASSASSPAQRPAANAAPPPVIIRTAARAPTAGQSRAQDVNATHAVPPGHIVAAAVAGAEADMAPFDQPLTSLSPVEHGIRSEPDVLTRPRHLMAPAPLVILPLAIRALAVPPLSPPAPAGHRP